MKKQKCLVLEQGSINRELIKKYQNAGYTFVCENAYVAACLQDGTVFGVGLGETIMRVYSSRSLEEVVYEYKIIVLHGSEPLFPIFVNRWNGVPKSVQPNNLLEVKAGTPNYNMKHSVFICPEAAAAYDKMVAAANADGLFLKVNYAYRSIDEQEALIARFTKNMGAEKTKKFTAPVGFSEHHTGLAMDVSGAVDQDGNSITVNDDVYMWLSENCYKYGFMLKNLSGKESVTGSAYEPWHIRYLGNLELAAYLHNNYLTMDEYIAMECEKIEYEVNTDDIDEYEYVALTARKSDRHVNELSGAYKTAKERYGLPYGRYYRRNMYKYSEKSCNYQSELLLKEQEAAQRYYAMVYDATDMEPWEVDEHIAILNKNPYAVITLAEYAQLKLYDGDEERITDVLKTIRNRRTLAKAITEEFQKIDNNESDYSIVEPMIAKYCATTKKVLMESEIEEFRDDIEKSCPELFENREALEDTVVDMTMCRRLMGFWGYEYFMFKLAGRTIAERREYISNSDRTMKISKVNNRVKAEFLDNKFLSYCILKDFYKREIIMVNSMEDYEVYADYVSRHPHYVEKPINGTMGKGVALVKSEEFENAEDMLRNRLEDIGPFVAEEQVIAHPSFKRVNPDSINTIRITTYNDGEKVHILWPWMKVGRAGAFVDNSGAGGMGVVVDINTGRLTSEAKDEYGHHFAVHPDNGLVFAEYQIENWEEALEFGRSAARALSERVEGINYVGWDVTYTEKGEWIIIEGNIFPQFVQQATYAKGFKKDLDKIIK